MDVADGVKIDGLEIFRDGKPLTVAEWGVKVPVDGGEHRIDARAPGHTAWSAKVAVASRRASVSVPLPRLPLSPVAPVPPPSPSHGEAKPSAPPWNFQRVAGVVAVSAGAVALGIGGAFGLRAISKQDSARGDCSPDETRCGPSGLAEVRDARSAANVATFALTVGAVLAVGGFIVYLTAPR